jgi:hypothetical protein
VSALAFYGASDDLVVVEVDGKPVDEIGCWNKPVTITFSHQGDGRCELQIEHGKRGWECRLYLHDDFDDGEELPRFTVEASRNGYSQVWRCELDALWCIECSALDERSWSWPVGAK